MAKASNSASSNAPMCLCSTLMKTCCCLPYSPAPAARLKSGLTLDLLGLTTGMDGSTAKRNQDMGLMLIKTALNQSGHLPKTHFDNAESFNAYFIDKGPSLIDATEQRTQRPQAADYQRGMYSGKKKPTPSNR
ncbi:hypothetical protein [Spirosoma luteolum]